MESLALVASLVVLSVIAFGVASALLAWKPRRSVPGRALAIVVGAAAALSGAWLASLQVGTALDTLGVMICTSGCVAVLANTKRFWGLTSDEPGADTPDSTPPPA
jgi:hypothetical protein